MLRRARFRLLQGGGPPCLEALGARLSLQQQPWSQESDDGAAEEGLAAPAAFQQVFGQQEALRMVGKAPGLLAVNSSVWQRALAVMELCGLTRKAALEVVRTNPDVLAYDWLGPSRLANRLAMERCLRLSAGQAYEQHAGYITKHGAKRVAGRLLFMQHHGLLDRLVTQKNGAKQEQQQGEPVTSLRNVCKLPDAQFASLPAVAAAGGLPALRAFQAGLEANPAWQGAAGRGSGAAGTAQGTAG
ncbi:hypothetical protein ABPG75_003681 [Micractinium tetrahymenae]